MSTRTVTVMVVVTVLLVIGGTALAIGGQFGSGATSNAQAADNPDLSELSRPEVSPNSGLTTLVLEEDPAPVATTRDDFLPFANPTSTSAEPPAAPESSLASTTTSPHTTTTSSPPNTTTTAPPTTTSLPPTTTTTAPPSTTTTSPATTTTTVPATTTTVASGGSFSSSGESQFVSLINSVRAGLGVAPLTVSSSLKTYARDWSFTMADTNTFEHSNIGSLLGPWSTVGENIAYGWSVASMHDALMASPGHYANLTNENFTHIGVGVWIEESGKIWTTHVFGG